MLPGCRKTFITDDTEQIAADANEALNTASAKFAKQAHRFDQVQLSPELARKRLLLELAAGFPAPDDPKAQKELAQILASLDGDYGKGKWCPDGEKKPCLDVTAVGKLMATSRDPEELKRAWLGWHAVGAPMRQRYARMVELGDQGSRQLGYSDVGALWRSNYDYASRRLPEGTRSPLDAIAAALCVAACVCARPTRQEIWCGGCSTERPDSRVFTRQYLGAGVEQHL